MATTNALPAEPEVVAETSPVVGESTTEIQHQPTLYAEPIFNLAGLPVTNSLLTSWLAVAIIIVASIALRRRVALIPRGLQNLAETMLEGALSLADSVTGSRQKSLTFLPLVLPLFLFILVSNWLGIIPGVGSIGFIHGGDHPTFVPLLRGSTADLNTTLALAIASIVITHIAGVVMTGAWAHINRFVAVKELMAIPGEVRRGNFAAILVNPIHFFVGLIEVVGELAKIASLSFRLFGNVFAGEVLLGAMAAIFAYALPIPFLFLEVLVGLIQALIFAMLVLVFLTIMSTSHQSEEHVPQH